MLKRTMLFGQKFLSLISYCILLILVVAAVDHEDEPPNRLRINAELVDTTNISYGLRLETPIFEDNENKVLDLIFYLDHDSRQQESGRRTICICMNTNAGLENQNTPTKDCSGFSRICFNKDRCFGKDEGQMKYFQASETRVYTFSRTYYKFHIIVNGDKAIIKQKDDKDVVLDIAPFSLYAPSELQLPKLSIGLITFFQNVNTATDCTDQTNERCHHADLLYLKIQVNPRKDSSIIVNVPPTSEPEQLSTANETSTSPTSPALTPSTSTAEENATGSLTALYVCIGVVVAIVIL